MMIICKGSCHCGVVQYRITDVPEPEEFTRCDCSICRKKNALMWMVPLDKLEVTAGQDKLTLYQWNLNIAKHYFCSICGIYTFHQKRMAPDHYGVNVQCLEGINIENVPVRSTQGSSLSVVD